MSFPLRFNRRFWICAGIFAVYVVWLYLWPYTGDGDSMLHYWNLRRTFTNPSEGLTSWARPVYVLLMFLPARGGVFFVRCFTALVTTILAWQTMRLADDLELPNATMAGPLLAFQPFVFALASDTMTEMPMALGIAVALRLWFARKYALSCLIVSLLPLLRPEGFFIAPVWGLFLLFLPLRPEYPGMVRRILDGSLMATGIVVLLGVCYFVTGDVLYFVHAWSWPAKVAGYGSGPLWHHFVLWPGYCGVVLFPLFILGIVPSLRKRMALPWAVWGIVILTHTILFWLGAFGAIGLMRILACTAPVTALIMLHGWNWITERKFYRDAVPLVQWTLPALVVLAAAAIAMIDYRADPTHHKVFLASKAADYARQNNLVGPAPRFFAGDPMVLAALDYPDHTGQLVNNSFDRKEELKQLAELPIGSVGVWDNQQGQMWHNVKPEEFDRLGYTTLFETSHRLQVYPLYESMFPLVSWPLEQRFVVVRKDRAVPTPLPDETP
jgi:hypothetical protein